MCLEVLKCESPGLQPVRTILSYAIICRCVSSCTLKRFQLNPSQFVWPDIRWPTRHLVHIWETDSHRIAHPLYCKWWCVLSWKETWVSWDLAHLQDFLQSSMKQIWPLKSNYMHFPPGNGFLQDFFLKPRNFSEPQFSYLWDGIIYYIY